jgi:hypothetical protein
MLLEALSVWASVVHRLSPLLLLQETVRHHTYL